MIYTIGSDCDLSELQEVWCGREVVERRFTVLKVYSTRMFRLELFKS